MSPVTDRHAARPQAILIAGPTASGKSALALALARAFGGTIVNMDSMQVYADLRRLSARPAPEEEAQVPHRLYGTVDGAVNFSVGNVSRETPKILTDVETGGRLPIFVGGTGLYFRALDEGLSEMPTVPDAVREAVRARAKGRETEALHTELAALDPAGAGALRPTDRMRVMRAIEVFEATGQPIAAFQGRRIPGPLAGRPLLKFFLDVDRHELRRRIDARFLTMMEEGALDEVTALHARKLDPMLPVMRAHGVPGLIAHLDGQISREEAITRGQGDTRRYAKRQYTWFRHQMGDDWIWTDPEAARRIAEDRLSAPAGR
ncbi:tRNA (adenosine(37)-N6)-dimethylallyltransferase MiaA [Methylobacterium haplocladii]|uniref:tRNA dimethylallyltransferase n=1 Tax=Methylobacterium haplocladii TaxID=1176176 RepID=A0A512IQ45_9HYPH|nr:tRNA (adenosine(37)-N6)-dimethylallyltransferase MiaA [Methylobacterium haplocladii]GEO99792.1 tRNA dimethylallyltransferase [Methylobacterium haplocladii]GJD84576.1 tRNA dimethylallyltransferase [Methylobacterium haplocladii]GLS60006.1 tRNA dimethylallyltransferase [Methylobacterium haplocladii]